MMTREEAEAIIAKYGWKSHESLVASARLGCLFIPEETPPGMDLEKLVTAMTKAFVRWRKEEYRRFILKAPDELTPEQIEFYSKPIAEGEDDAQI
jgi:hypothetical protein